MTLSSEHQGSGPRIVLLHGFTQTARCWGPVGADLARDHELMRIDAPGHGDSADIHADLDRSADLIAETGGRGTYLGYSMGARMALYVALAHPELVERLILVGGTAGIEDPAERAERRARDEQLAQRIRRDGVDAFLAGWLDQPLFAGLPAWARFDAERSRNTPEGLARSLELAGTATMRPRWSELERLAMPVLVVAGADDTRFAALADRMAAAIGDNAQVALVPGAGHAAHLEQPDRFLEVLARQPEPEGEEQPEDQL